MWEGEGTERDAATGAVGDDVDARGGVVVAPGFHGVGKFLFRGAVDGVVLEVEEEEWAWRAPLEGFDVVVYASFAQALDESVVGGAVASCAVDEEEDVVADGVGGAVGAAEEEKRGCESKEPAEKRQTRMSVKVASSQ